MVIRTLLLFLPVAGLLAGCRTYVGYDPIVKQESRICRENAVLEHSRYGVNCQWSWDRTILTFGTVALANAYVRRAAAFAIFFSSFSLFLSPCISFLDFFVFSGWLIGLRSFASGHPLRPAAWRSALDERQMLRCQAFVEEPLVFHVV